MADHDHISAALERLLAMPEGERRAELKHLAHEDPQQAAELESLLAAHEADPEFLDHLDADGAVHLLEEDERLLMPERAGDYRLIREIGRGGLGVVYLAERDAGDFDKQVALKVIKRGMDSDLILKRFHHERRILASLEHPNVARLIDGGLLEDGRPYFTMELVDGVPITDWCDQHQADIRQRLDLFDQVLTAVQYAHRHLVVHRDLKPANILVTEDAAHNGTQENPDSPGGTNRHSSGACTVKLLDFGIAKLLDQDDNEVTRLTLAGMHAMTPEYAAPEQVRGEPASTATDVYALGVLLYELLSGHHPFRNGADTREALNRAICDTTPTLPSAMIGGERAEAIASTRGTRPTALRRRLQGDLDNVVLKAMAKEPERRYGSVEELREDIRRHRIGVPVRARRETWSYRASRFLYRHRLGVTATAAMVLALATGLGMAVWQAGEARLQADEAMRQAERAEQVSDFLTELFRVNDPNENRGETLTARELLERGAERIEAELDGQPYLQFTLAALISDIHLSLGEYDRAEQMLERAWMLHDAVDNRLTEIKLLRARAELAHRRGHYAMALDWFDRAESLIQPTDGAEISAALNHNRAMALLEGGQFQEAEHSFREAIRMYELSVGADAAPIADSLNGLGYLLWKRLDRIDEARSAFERALEIARHNHGEVHPTTSGITMHLGWLLSERGEFEQAEVLLKRSLASGAKLWGEDGERYAHSLVSYGNFESDRGQPEAAIEAYQQAYEIYMMRLGPDHPYPSYPLHNMSLRFYEAGDFEQALAHADECLQIRRRALEPTNPLIASAQQARGRALFKLARYPEAKSALTEALELREQSLPEGHWQTRETRFELLLTNMALEGVEPYQDAATELLQTFPPDSPALEQARGRLRSMGVVLE